jgi:hypothetical protein
MNKSLDPVATARGSDTFSPDFPLALHFYFGIVFVVTPRRETKLPELLSKL